jgi:hypothetical protein
VLQGQSRRGFLLKDPPVRNGARRIAAFRASQDLRRPGGRARTVVVDAGGSHRWGEKGGHSGRHEMPGAGCKGPQGAEMCRNVRLVVCETATVECTERARGKGKTGSTAGAHEGGRGSVEKETWTMGDAGPVRYQSAQAVHEFTRASLWKIAAGFYLRSATFQAPRGRCKVNPLVRPGELRRRRPYSPGPGRQFSSYLATSPIHQAALAVAVDLLHNDPFAHG